MVLASCHLIVIFQWIIGIVVANTTGTAVNNIVWCGLWAGRPAAQDKPVSPYHIPTADTITRLFVQPELQAPPFASLSSQAPIVQLPKTFGYGQFRLALLSYTTHAGAIPFTFPIGYSTWSDVLAAFESLMTSCVQRGTGGAIIVPPLPRFTQPSLVLYAYTPGSRFDRTFITTNVRPCGIDPRLFQGPFLNSTNDSATACVSAPLETPAGHPNVAVTS